jgi:DegV family protein with EDD domain
VPNVAVVTDSAASIPEALIAALRIHWVPYYVERGRESLRDRVTIQCDEFYRWMSTAPVAPKTASPGPGDYLTLYEHLARDEDAREIISIHMTARGSGAYQAATVARSMLAETLPHMSVEVVDTLNVAMCQGWMAIEAGRAALTGASLADVLAVVRRLIPITRMALTAETLKYLYMGGRIGRAKHLLGSLLNIKPLIGMEDGLIVPLGVARSRHKAYQMMADLVAQAAVTAANAAGAAAARINIAYVHAAARAECDEIKRLVEERLAGLAAVGIQAACAESLFAELSPALGVHSGPGTVGVCFYPVIEQETGLP